jgi:hypothetical protein
VTGPGIDTASAIYFANIKSSGAPDCRTDSCTVPVPRGLAKNTIYYLYAQNAAGLSAAIPKSRSTPPFPERTRPKDFAVRGIE